MRAPVVRYCISYVTLSPRAFRSESFLHLRDDVREVVQKRIRHFADDVVNGLAAGRELDAAITAAVQRWMGWTIGRRTARETGIPIGLPYLTGFVIHCEIEADADD